MKVHINFIKAFGILLIAALLFTALPVGEVKAQDGSGDLLARVNASQLRITPENGAVDTIGYLLVIEFGLSSVEPALTETVALFWFNNYDYVNKFQFASLEAVEDALTAAQAEHAKLMATLAGDYDTGYPSKVDALESYMAAALRLAGTSDMDPKPDLEEEIVELAPFLAAGVITPDGKVAASYVGLANSISGETSLLGYITTFGQASLGGLKVHNITKGTYYAIIQAAVDAADAGDTIYAAAGTYNENVVIDKSLALIGAGREVTTVQAASALNPAIEVTADNVTVSGFKATGATDAGTAGIQLSGVSNCSVVNNTATGNERGIRLTKSLNNIIEGNIASSNNKHGIVLYDGSSNNQVKGNDANQNANSGFYIFSIVGGQPTTGNQFIENVANDNLSNGFLLIDNTDGNTLEGNTFNGNKKYGVSISTSNNNIIRNTISGNGFGDADGAGVALFNPVTGNKINFNTISGNFGKFGGVGSTSTKQNDATKNWWGTETGPIHASNPGGTGNKVSDNVAYSPWLGFVPGTQPMEWHLNVTGTIQEGIDAAAVGDSVLVHPGTYNETPVLNKPDLILKSTDGRDNTIIDAGGANLGVTINQNLGIITIDGFTVINWQQAGIVQPFGQRAGTASHIFNNKVVGGEGDAVHGNCIQVTGDKSWVKGNIAEGAYYIGDHGYGASGILAYLSNDAVIEDNAVINADLGIAISGGSIFGNFPSATNVKITGNTVSNSEICIGVFGDAKDTEISGNTVYDCDLGIAEPFERGLEGPSNTTAKNNKIYGNEVDLSVYADEDSEIPGDHIFDASPNWFGSPCGPSEVEGEEVVYAPWYVDEEMTTTTDVPPVSGEYTFPTTMGSAEKNAIIACAAPGTAFTFDEGEHAGGIIIDNDYLTFNLNGATLGAGSPAFTVGGDNVIINGPGLLDGNQTDHAIFVRKDVTNLTVNKLEIKNWADGVHYAGKITNTQVVDTYFHELGGDAIHFTEQPIIETPLSFYIQGNMFLMETIGGFGVNAPGALDVTYNSWGDKDGPGGNDLPGAFETSNYTPFTHVDISMLSTNPDVDNWLNQVFVADADPRHDHETITYQVKANLVNVTGADFVFDYPEDFVTVKELTLVTELFKGIESEPVVKDDGDKIHFVGETALDQYGAISATDEVLFEVTFEGKAPKKSLLLELNDQVDEFAMFPGTGPSHNIYAYKLEDGKLDVIDRPTLEVTGLDTPFVAGVMSHEIANKICNPPTGGDWQDDRPGANAIGWIRISNITIDKIASLQFKYNDDWYDFEVQGGDVIQQDGPDVIVRYGNYNYGMLIPNLAPETWCDIDYFRATFLEPGEHDVTVEIYDMMNISPADKIEEDYILLAYYGPETITIIGDFDVKGTISMQGRTVRAGVPLTLTDMDGTPVYGPFTGTSGPELAYNVLFTGVNGGTYEITTNQARYLNVHAGLGKKISISGAYTIPALELKGGNAVWDDNVIDLLDASAVGTAYGWTGDTAEQDADVNFDGRVSIQDLALVGGNFDLTSGEAYAGWTP